MKYTFFILLVSFYVNVFAQKETFDLATYTSLKRWKKQSSGSTVQFTKEDAAKGTYCIITLYKAVSGTTSSKQNFDLAWASLVKEMVTVSAAPEMQPSSTENGWEVHSGYAPFEKEGNKGVVILVTSSGFEKMMNLIILTNTDVYEKEMTAFLESVSLKKPAVAKQANSKLLSDQAGTKKPEKPINQPVATSNGFVFTSSNFDDGWNSVCKEDWVEVTKGNIKALLHYPNAVSGKYYSDSDEGINAAWNNLVAPRYEGLQNYTAWYSTSILPRPFVIAGDVTDKQSGKKVYVILFKKGNIDWIEIISPDKNTFINNFGVDNTTLSNYADPKIFALLEKLAEYNKFAIAAIDLKGKWSDKFSASFFNYNTSDGQYTGMNTIASVSNFIFTSASSYNWDAYSTNNAHSAGSAKTFKTTGTFKMINNWQIQFSDIQGKPKTYSAYFSCFKGGRVLWLQDKDYGGYMAYGKVE
jgi:hypothetical protein